ncbi:hypothetical protein P029_02900 [Anaplasma phagocytophilum str. Norway variant2]|uniref:Uncharacterized protein n=1 Tax=Anaplasma phagocytophilum str. Norway variant2 TaxID=1392507 RepID=A0A168HBW7_ANAPH|nr:hypothetical protein [Anaplasma phagocytophilum]ANC34307.1 hypothetical protein P029_02900 [Anaplasma phagocytophilum str. Norway variant2]
MVDNIPSPSKGRDDIPDTHERIIHYINITAKNIDDSIVEMDSIRDILQEMEGEALSVDSRIVNSEGASFSKSFVDGDCRMRFIY